VKGVWVMMAVGQDAIGGRRGGEKGTEGEEVPWIISVESNNQESVPRQRGDVSAWRIFDV
jgi:hypothetical protein